MWTHFQFRGSKYFNYICSLSVLVSFFPLVKTPPFLLLMEIGCLDVDLFEGKNALRSRSGWVIPVSSITLVCSITFFSSQAFVEKKYGGMAVWSIGWLTSLVEHLYVCLKFAIWCSVTYWLLLRLCSIIFCFLSCWTGTQAFIWSPQSQGVLAFDPYPQEQVEVCSDLSWSYFNLDAASSYGWWQGQDWQDIHLDSWVRCMPDHNFGFMITMLWPLLAPDSIISYIFPADVVSIPKTGENFRLLYDTKGRFRLHSIRDDEAKVCIHHWLRSRSGFCMLFMLPCSQTTST